MHVGHCIVAILAQSGVAHARIAACGSSSFISSSFLVDSTISLILINV